MMKDKRGFIAISVIYSFFVVFLMILLIIINTYYNNRASFNLYKDKIKIKNIDTYKYTIHETKYLTDVIKDEINKTKNLDSGVNYDGSRYGSYRYFGSTPNNYVCFGTDLTRCTSNAKYLFRVVGVFKEDTITGSGTGFVTKVVRANPLPTSMKYNTGSNVWSTSSLYTYLNSTYLTDISLTNFDERFEEKIVEAKWGFPALKIDVTGEAAYTKEMDALRNASTSVTAKVGLISAADWGYAPKKIGACTPITTALNKYNSGLNFTCYKYDWLNGNQWFINPSESSGYAMTLSTVVDAVGESNLKQLSVGSTKPIFPAFYLAPDVVVMSGSGTRADPYILNVLAEGS